MNDRYLVLGPPHSALRKAASHAKLRWESCYEFSI